MAFSSAQYERIYKRFLGPLASSVVLMVNNGKGYTVYAGVNAYVSNYKESDLVQGGSIELGDLRLIIPSSELPIGLEPMNRSDRIDIKGRTYAVVHWDGQSRSMGDDLIAVEVAVRG